MGRGKCSFLNRPLIKLHVILNQAEEGEEVENFRIKVLADVGFGWISQCR